jgi:hypothetical protein
MLDAVIAHYLEALTEREFDAPFEALLRVLGFTKINCLHGPFEFGKDFIAQREVDGVLLQYAVQSKAGDVDGSDWRSLRGQLEDLVLNDIAHPDFDATLPRQPVLVLTGRLKGGASASAQEYKASLERRHFRPLEVWGLGTLVEMLAGDARAALRGSLELELEELVIGARTGHATEAAVRRFAERWAVVPGRPEEVWRNCLQASVACEALLSSGRVDLAACLPLLLARELWRRSGCPAEMSDEGQRGVDLAYDLFRHYARELWQKARDADLSAEAIASARRDEMFFTTYPVWCSRIMEVIGLLGLDPRTETSEREAMRVFLRKLVEGHSGCSHPLSDHWAASLVPVCIFLGGTHSAVCQAWLTGVTKWTCDAYEGGVGLAPVHAGPEQEVTTLLGAAFDHVDVVPRRTSYIACVVLDLCAAFEWGELYDVAYNEFAACDVYPLVVEPAAEESTCAFLGEGGIVEVNAQYAESWPDGGDWRVAPHHWRAKDCFFMGRGDAWSGVAMGIAVRDRHLLCCVRALAEAVREAA